MKVSRRAFVQGGVAAFTYSFAAPAILCRMAQAQGQTSRSLVVLDLTGGNDSLSMLVPYNDSFYYSRRPALSIPAANVLQVGTDSSGVALGLHPRLTGLKDIFNQGRLAFIQRTGYENSSRSHFQGTDIWSTANPTNTQGSGWLGKYLDSLGANQDPLVAWNTFGQTPHAVVGNLVGVPSIPDPAHYAFSSPNSGADATLERTTTMKIASHLPVTQPQLSFVGTVAEDAMATLDRVATVAGYAPSVTYPNNGLGSALKAVAGAMAKGVGTKIFWVQLGGFDTHSAQQVTQNNGAYMNLMATLNDGLLAFYNDLTNLGLLSQTLILNSPSSAGASVRTAAAAPTMAPPARSSSSAAACGAASTAPRPRSVRMMPAIPRLKTAAATCTSRRTSDPSTRGSSTTGLAEIRWRYLVGTTRRRA